MYLERLKNARIETLERQLEVEQLRAQQAQQRTLKLKERYLGTLETLRSSLLAMPQEDVEDCSVLQKLTRENKCLRELLALSREGEGELPAVPETEYQSILQQYRQKKLNAQRSKSYSNSNKKGYLLASAKSGSSSPDSNWDSFFRAKERPAKSPPERYDQAEEPK